MAKGKGREHRSVHWDWLDAAAIYYFHRESRDGLKGEVAEVLQVSN